MNSEINCNFSEIEEAIGYSFKNRNLLKLALTHSSFGHEIVLVVEGDKDNERLEFLGDAVLELISSEYLFKNHNDMTEGKLSKLRASLVCEPSLAKVAREIGLNKYIMLGKGERQNGGGERDSIISDAFEALIGAMYLDGGLEVAREFIEKNVLNNIEDKVLFYDAKTELQVLVQNHYQCTPTYEVLKEEGPPHNRTYTVSCLILDKPYGEGVGNSKKSAQQKAAYAAILKFREELKCI